MSLAIGSEYEFNTNSTKYIITRMLTSSTFVVAYSNNGTATAVIGTVSGGNTISYGSPVGLVGMKDGHGMKLTVLDSTHFVISFQRSSDLRLVSYAALVSDGNTITFGSAYNVSNTVGCGYPTIAKLTATTFAVFYSTPTPATKVKVGTISNDTTISYGSEQAWLDNGSNNEKYSCTLDSTHIAVLYLDDSDSSYNVVVAAESSGTISFGTKQALSPVTVIFDIRALSASLFIASYAGTSQYGQLRSGSVSGTDITLGTEKEVVADTVYTQPICSLDSSTIGVCYNLNSDSDHGRAVTGTISAGVITLDTPVEYNAGAIQQTSGCDSLDSTHFAIAFRDDGDSNYGNSVIATYTASAGPTNLKSVNGLAKASIKSIKGLAIGSVKKYNGLA